MHRYWEIIVEPILTAVQPESIVEIGAEFGNSTKRLLEYCACHHSRLCSIDPFPQFDVQAWQDQYGDTFSFYKSLSLSALPLIDRFDLVFIDGDHNWYTVFNELKLIEHRCKKEDHPFPLIFFHDIGWPYGRRDLYYDPDNIPELYRKPYKQKGMVPGQTDLADDGGLNPDLCNAVYENDLQNGVLTAIEDFIQDTGFDLELITLPGLYGLGIMVPKTLLQTNSELALRVDAIRIHPSVKTLIEKVETDRILKQLAVNRRDDELSRINEKLKIVRAEHEEKLASYQAVIQGKKDEIAKQQNALTEKQNALEEKQAALKQKKDELDQTTRMLNKKIQNRDEQKKQMIRLFERVQSDFSGMLASNRWRMGDAIGRFIQAVLFRKKVPMAHENILKTFQEYNRMLAESPDKKNSKPSRGAREV